MTMPDGFLVPFGDTLAEKAPAFAKAYSNQKGLQAYLESGYAIVRKNDSYLAMTCCYHTYAHKHADELSWCLHEGGRLVVGEAARHGFRDEKDPARVYARSSQGHNTLILNDHSFDWKRDPPYGSGLLASGEQGGWYAILGRNPLLHTASHSRLLLYRPEELVVILDHLKAEEQQNVLRRLHFGPTLVANISDSHVVARTGPKTVATTLADWSKTPTDIDVGRGLINDDGDVDGWTFPNDNTKLETSVVSLRNRIESGVLIHSLQLQSVFVDEINAWVDENNFSLSIQIGSKTTTVDITHLGDHLSISIK